MGPAFHPRPGYTTPFIPTALFSSGNSGSGLPAWYRNYPIWRFSTTGSYAALPAAEVTSILGFGMPSFLGEGSWIDDLAQLAVLDVV